MHLYRDAPQTLISARIHTHTVTPPRAHIDPYTPTDIPHTTQLHTSLIDTNNHAYTHTDLCVTHHMDTHTHSKHTTQTLTSTQCIIVL